MLQIMLLFNLYFILYWTYIPLTLLRQDCSLKYIQIAVVTSDIILDWCGHSNLITQVHFPDSCIVMFSFLPDWIPRMMKDL